MKSHRVVIQFIYAALLLTVSFPVSAGTPSGSTPGNVLSGKVALGGQRGVEDAVVYIVTAPGSFTPPQETPRMDQRNIKFAPHVLPVLVGTTVSFVNSDDLQHNVFTPSKAGNSFNLGTWPKGQAKPYTFTKLGRVDLLCNVHSEMSGYILVLQNPYFAVTDKEGNFQIKDVPPGNYQLKVWHERGTAAAVPVQIANDPVTVNFSLSTR